MDSARCQDSISLYEHFDLSRQCHPRQKILPSPKEILELSIICNAPFQTNFLVP